MMRPRALRPGPPEKRGLWVAADVHLRAATSFSEKSGDGEQAQTELTNRVPSVP